MNNVCVSWHYQNAIVYRTDLHNLQTRQENSRVTSGCVANDVSVNVKTKNAFKYDYFTVFLLSEKYIIYTSLKHLSEILN